MPDVQNKPEYRFYNAWIFSFLKKIKKASLPGFEGVPIYDVVIFFFKGFQKGSMGIRASSIAFNLCIALLPSTIFLFTLIPFIPIPNFQAELLTLFENILPENAFLFMESTIVEVITKKSGGLLLLMFVATIIFSTNGIHALLSAFNITIHSMDTRGWLAQRGISFALVFILTSLLSIAVILILFSKMAIQKLVDLELIRLNLPFYIVQFGKWIIIIALIFFAISFLYYLAPAKKTKWRFISAGSSLATILFIISSLGFSYFVNNFGKFNTLYGSIGTLIVILLWLYFNSISLLIGFELNASIKSANIIKEDIYSGENSQIA
jgi:membrane protein